MFKDTTNEVHASVKIPKVKFYLKNSKIQSTGMLILAAFMHDKKRVFYSTKVHVDSSRDSKTGKLKYWKSKIGKAVESVNYRDGADINESLTKVETTIRGLYKGNPEVGRSWTAKQVKDELDYLLCRKKRDVGQPAEHKTFVEFVNYQVELNKERVGGKKGGQTWQKYESMKKRIQLFCDAKGYLFNYENVNEVFLEQFIVYLEKKGLSQNTISKDVETIKTLLRKSKRYHSNSIYKESDYNVKRLKTSKHYPTLDELKHLYSFVFKSDSVRRVVDLYLLSAFAGGLRISDILSLSEKNKTIIEGETYLTVYTYKSRDKKEDNHVVIPLNVFAISIIEKYNWKFPKFSNRYINDTLKDAFEEAKLFREKLMNSAVKDSEQELVRLCDHVHFHTARSAYIDWMLNDMDIPPQKLQNITGQGLDILMSYVRTDKTKNAVKVGSIINQKLTGLTVIKNEAV